MGLASGRSVHGSRLSGGFHLPSLVAVLCSAVAVSRGRPGCLRDTSGGPSLRNTSSSTGDSISSRCSDYEQPGKPPAIDCPEVPSLHHVEVRVVAGHPIHIYSRSKYKTFYSNRTIAACGRRGDWHDVILFNLVVTMLRERKERKRMGGMISERGVREEVQSREGYVLQIPSPSHWSVPSSPTIDLSFSSSSPFNHHPCLLLCPSLIHLSPISQAQQRVSPSQAISDHFKPSKASRAHQVVTSLDGKEVSLCVCNTISSSLLPNTLNEYLLHWRGWSLW